MFQSGPGRTIDLNFGLFVNRLGGDQIELGEGKIALRGEGLKCRSGPECLLFLGDFEGALRQVSRLACRIHARGGLFKRVFRIA